jgi:hypothetical protein
VALEWTYHFGTAARAISPTGLNPGSAALFSRDWPHPAA